MARIPTLKPALRAISTAVAAPARSTGDSKAYASPEHRAWRTAVLARSGNACQSCGRTGVRLFADHIVELRDGGAALDVRNGQALCGSCHSTKTAAARAARQQR